LFVFFKRGGGGRFFKRGRLKRFAQD